MFLAFKLAGQRGRAVAVVNPHKIVSVMPSYNAHDDKWTSQITMENGAIHDAEAQVEDLMVAWGYQRTDKEDEDE